MNIQQFKRILVAFKVTAAWGKNAPLFGKPAIDGNTIFRATIAIVVVLGIVFRLGNLSVKPYWEDEVYTSTLVAGYEIENIAAELKGTLTPVESLSKYQDVQLGKSWKDVSVALAKRPEHTPLYFLLARAWAECFGSSVTAMRAFPAITSLLTLPLFYWLSFLLFDSVETAAVTLGLACTSPILIRYAQDARPYSLWIVGVLLSSAMLLHSLKHNRRRNWLLYSASVAFAVMTNWLSGFVFMAHGCQVIVARRYAYPQSKIVLQRFSIALSIGLLPVIPWAGLVIYGRHSVRAVLSWLEQEETLATLSIKWLGNLSHILFAWEPSGDRSILLVVPLFLISWSTFQLIKNPVQQWLLPILLCVVPTVVFVGLDLLLGGGRSLISRYFLAADVGALLILGFGLSATPLAPSVIVKKLLWPKRVLLYAVLTVSISSCWLNFNANNWWGEADFSRSAASIITQTSSPVDVYSDQRLSPFLAFALLLRPADRIMWLDKELTLSSETFDKSRATYLFEPSSNLLIQSKRASTVRTVETEQIEIKPKIGNWERGLFELANIEGK